MEAELAALSLLWPGQFLGCALGLLGMPNWGWLPGSRACCVAVVPSQRVNASVSRWGCSDKGSIVKIASWRCGDIQRRPVDCNTRRLKSPAVAAVAPTAFRRLPSLLQTHGVGGGRHEDGCAGCRRRYFRGQETKVWTYRRTEKMQRQGSGACVPSVPPA